jgi:hypothetical protein
MRIATAPFIFPDGTLVLDLAGLTAKVITLSDSHLFEQKTHIVQWIQTALDEPKLAAVLSRMPASQFRTFLEELIVLSAVDLEQHLKKDALTHKPLHEENQIKHLIQSIQLLGFNHEQAIVIGVSALYHIPLCIESTYKIPRLDALYANLRKHVAHNVTLKHHKNDILINVDDSMLSRGYKFTYLPVLYTTDEKLIFEPVHVKKRLDLFILSPKVIDLLNQKLPKSYFAQYNPQDLLEFIKPLIAMHAFYQGREYALPVDCVIALKYVFVK